MVELKGKPSLAEVDAREPGKVQLISIKLVDGFDEDPQQMYTLIEEGEDIERDPWLMAEGLMRSMEDDWPDHYWAIVGNWRAHYLRWRRFQRRMGPLREDDWSPESYLATFE